MFIKLLTLVTISAITWSGVLAPPEYYSLLGLSRGAGVNEVKRAFKRLAVKYHPDRAPADKKTEFQKTFSEISDAYSVLTDPELKNMYDQRGHAGLDDLRKHKDWQNQRNAHQEMHESQAQDLFVNTDVQILNMQSLSRFYRRNNVWLILFYRSQDQEMRAGVREAILDLNTRFYGVFTVAVVNCDQDEGICDEYRAINTPDILVFSSDIAHDGARYTGDKTAAKMAGFAVHFMQNFVSVVTPENAEEFLASSGRTKLLYFSAKKETPPLMKALSKEFRSTLDIAQVKNDDAGKLRSKYSVPKLPHVLALKTDGSVVHFEGEINLRTLSDFIREHRDLSVGSTSRKAVRRVYQVNSVKDLVNMGCGQESKLLCILVAHSDQQSGAVTNECQTTLRSLGDEPIAIGTISRSILNWAKFGEADDTGVLVLKPARGKYYWEQVASFSADHLRDVIDKAVGGSLTFKPLGSLFSSYFNNIDFESDL